MVLDALILQAKLFLQEDMSVDIINITVEEKDYPKLVLKDYTSMIGTGGKLTVMIVISYQKSMLDKLVELYMDGEEIDPDEEFEIKDSVSGEVINTIMGLALPTFPSRGKGVTITPPITINDAANIVKHKNSKIVSALIETKFGEFSISAVGAADSFR